MDTLPTEVVSHIISYLDLRYQLWLSTVSVWWREAVSDCLRRRRYLELDDSTDDELRALLPRLPSLRTLIVRCDHKFEEDKLDIDIVSENCSLLEKLDLRLFKVDMDSLERLCRRCPRLCDVRMSFRWRCKTTLLELLLRRLPRVRVLSLDWMEVSAAAVALLPACLERLELKSCHLHSCERQPADRWPRLTELVGSELFPSDGLAALLAGCPALRTLDAQGAGDLAIVSKNCPLLEKLDLSRLRLNADSLERLCRRCPRLCDVRLPRGCSSELLELLLHRLPGVRAIRLWDTDISAAAVGLLPACLEELVLSGCRLPEVPPQPADRWPRLTKLVLPDYSPGSIMAALVAGCPRLADFSCPDDDLLDILPALHLRHLDLAGAMLAEDRVVSRFGRLRQLRTLDLEHTLGVTDRVLEDLAVMESLTELMLGAEEGPLEFSMKALQRLVVTSRSLRLVRFDFDEQIDDFKWLIDLLDEALDPDRDFTLALTQCMLQELAEWAKPSEPSPLRLVMIHFRP